jgi:predicted aminopeptidase
MRRQAVALIGVAAAAALLAATTGCSTTIGYYAQGAVGHLKIIAAAEPVDKLVADPTQPAELRERLQLTQRMRDFAVTRLALPDNASYRRYADLGRNAAVWNVVAAPQLSLQLKTWCFMIVGCVGYRGYYDRAAADAQAATLESQDLDVAVYPVPAYSTLGWFSDPLLNTFIHWPEGDLARLIFHELAHQVAYAEGDTMFNESFATAVERIGGDLWLASESAAPGTAAKQEALKKSDERRRDFRALVGRFRSALQAVYASNDPPPQKRERKAALLAQLRAEHEALKAGAWGGYNGYDEWFLRVNNATLGVQAAYDAQVPAFERLFDRSQRDFPRFYAEVKRLAALKQPERDAAMRAP